MAAPPDFRAYLREQLGFLRRSIESFDAGFRDEALRMGVAIRVLVHDTRRSTPLLSHLGVRATARLMSTSPGVPVDRNVVFQFGLGMMAFGDGGSTVRPSLGEVSWRLVPVDEWWTQVIHVFDGGATRVSRKTMVLGAANKQDGAHVDPKLDPEFKRLVKDGAFLHLVERIQGIEVARPLLDLHLANLRDMAFEITNSPDILVLASTMFPGPFGDCGGKERRDVREPRIMPRNTFSATQCHELACGHAWHVTATLEGGAGPPLIYQRACDCALGEYDSRVARLVGKRHRRFAAYAWGKYEAEGLGAVVVWEADVHKKFSIPEEIEGEPVYAFGYCALEALRGSNLPTWLKENAERLLPPCASTTRGRATSSSVAILTQACSPRC